MKLENTFTVPAPIDRVWSFMLDVERVAPCMPGAEITEAVDENTWKGKVSVKLGPVSLAFAGTVVREQMDAEAHRVVMQAKGTETRGKGMAQATITSHLEPADEGTTIVVTTELQISGAAAQYGRGMIADVSERFTQEFADCLAERIGADGSGAGADETAVGAGAAHPGPGGGRAEAGSGGREAGAGRVARPVSGIRLGLWALFRALGRGVKRIFGGGSAGSG